MIFVDSIASVLGPSSFSPALKTPGQLCQAGATPSPQLKRGKHGRVRIQQAQQKQEVDGVIASKPESESAFFLARYARACTFRKTRDHPLHTRAVGSKYVACYRPSTAIAPTVIATLEKR